ncbi:myb-like DNA-binding domain protein [Colletotrichum tofieldiae]|uniref:Myb-like DNA-binding domain protein n=1 Tax=Colletotrichum tofieldiae TaxID=708197 RepID=A0A166W0M9_9PEZI|nr:myb-like DNA-binding domain protein [Colletotrichum tofieldiae]GKT91900.1 MYB-like DNA-binding domain-containing protein [Colletotrichum tofieldiae]
MEPPAKRPRVGPSPLGLQSKGDEDDELNYEPEEVSQMRDPGYQLEQSRAFAAFKLKSTFEHIFQKYERDFTGIGDEIDLRTGKIITNNGHLERMQNERDTGLPDEDDEEDEGMLLEDAFASGDEEDDEGGSDEDGADGNDDHDRSDDEEDEERILHGKKGATPRSTALVHKTKVELQHRSSLSHILPSTSGSGSEQRLSNLGPPRQPENGNLGSSANIWGYEPEFVDPTWRVPEITSPRLGDNLMSKLFGARYRFPVSQGSQSVWSSRQDSETEKATPEPARIDMAQLARARQEASRMARPTFKKLLQAFTTDDDYEDDILGVSAADREPRIETKKNGEDAAKVQGSVMVGKQTKSTVAGSSAKEPDCRKKTKSSVKQKLNSKKQLFPIKARKQRESTQQTEVSDEAVDQPVNATTQLNSAQGFTSFLTDKEAQERPKQQIVIELSSKGPPANEITEAEDPEDMDIFGSTDQGIALTPKLAGLTVSERSSIVSAPRESSVEAITDAHAFAGATSGKAPGPLKEKFTRHEIDPSYAFSDDEDGIPTTRAIFNRNQKQSISVPVANESLKPDFVTAMGPSQKVLELETSEDQQKAEARPETEAKETQPSPTVDKSAAEQSVGMDVDASKKQVAETTTALERHPSPHDSESSKNPSNIHPPSMLQPTEELSEERQSAERRIAGETNMAGTENTLLTANVVVQEPKSPNERNQETEMQGCYRKNAQEETQPEKIQEVRADDTREGTRTDSVQGKALEETEVETEVEHPAEDIQQEEVKECLEPFTIPLGLDEMDETSAIEADPEPETMDIELPNLPPSIEAPSRRARSSSLIPSGRVDESAISPMRHLSLRSSSPLKRYANPGTSSAKARRSVRFRASASPERKTPQNHKSSTGQGPALASETPNSETADIPDSSVVTQPSPAPNPLRRKRQPKQPSTPSSRHRPNTTKGSSSKKSIISLLSDNEDELTLELFKTWTSSGGSLGDRKRTSFTPVLLAGPQTKITTPMKQRIPGAGGADSDTVTARGRKRKAAWAFATPTKAHFGSPSGSLVRTPGGNMRRCGEDGFRCDRDFCFTCL